MAETRAERQAKIDARVAELRAQAAVKEAKATAIRGAVNQDPAFWTQPAYSNSAGRSFARHREAERNRIVKANDIAEEARELRRKADDMEARGAVMAGDKNAENEAHAAALEIKPGQVVNTIHFGPRKVLKVNKKTVLVEGSFGPLKVEKHFIRAA